MIDIAFDLARGLQHDAAAVHRADDVAADDDFLSRNAACDSCAFTDDDVAALDVSLDNSVDLDLALADQIAGDRKVGADDGDRPGRLWPGGPSDTAAAETTALCWFRRWRPSFETWTDRFLTDESSATYEFSL